MDADKSLLLELRNLCKRSPIWKPVMNMEKAHKYFLCRYQIDPITIYCSVSNKQYENILRNGFGELEYFPQFYDVPIINKKPSDVILVCLSSFARITKKDLVIVGRFNEFTSSTSFKKTILDAQKLIKNKKLFSNEISKDVMNTKKQSAILAYHGTSLQNFQQIMKDNYYNRQIYNLVKNFEGTYFYTRPYLSFRFAKNYPATHQKTDELLVNIVLVSRPSPWGGKWKNNMSAYKMNNKYVYDISIGNNELRTYDNKMTFIIGTISKI